MRCRTFLSPFVLFVVVILCPCCNVFLLPACAAPEEDAFTQQELEEVYKALPEQDKEVVDSWSAAEKEKYLRAKAKTARESSSEEPRSAAKDVSVVDATPSLYTLDPLLREAMTKYQDTKVPREEVLGLFNKYIENTPDSAFLPEVYFRMGALYSMHRRVELGERYDRRKMMEYFQKAHEIYGTKYSHLHVTLWDSLANMPENDLAFRKDYLRWLQGMSDLDANDVWLVPQIEQTFNGRPPELDVAQREVIVRNLQKHKGLYFDTASKNTLYIEGGNQQSLLDLAKSFPGTELARQCLRLAEARDRFYLDVLDANEAPASLPQTKQKPGNVQHPGEGTDPNGKPQSMLPPEKGEASGHFSAFVWGAGLVVLATACVCAGRHKMKARSVAAQRTDCLAEK